MNISRIVSHSGTVQSLAAWVQRLVTEITAGWNVEHATNGSHDIRWQVPMFEAAHFRSPSGTWVVANDNIVTFAYHKVGRAVTFSVVINSSTVAGTPAYLEIQIPFTATSFAINPCVVGDNGTIGLGSLHVIRQSNTIQVYRSGLAAWSASAALTNVQGQVTCEVSE